MFSLTESSGDSIDHISEVSKSGPREQYLYFLASQSLFKAFNLGTIDVWGVVLFLLLQ